MPVEKFRSIEEMNAASDPRSAEDAVARFIRHCARHRALHPKSWTPGVHRFRSIDEARAARRKPQAAEKTED